MAQTADQATVSLLRWLRRQLRQSTPLREHLEAAVANDDPHEARRHTHGGQGAAVRKGDIDDEQVRSTGVGGPEGELQDGARSRLDVGRHHRGVGRVSIRRRDVPKRGPPGDQERTARVAERRHVHQVLDRAVAPRLGAAVGEPDADDGAALPHAAEARAAITSRHSHPGPIDRRHMTTPSAIE